MDLRGAFFGSKLRIAGTAVVGVVLLVVVLFIGGVFGVPSIVGVSNAFGTVNASTTEIVTNVTVHNPNPIGIGLGTATIEYTVMMNEIEMASGAEHGIGIGTGNSTLQLHTYLQNSKIPTWWVSHIQNGERTALEVTAHVSSGFGLSTTQTPVQRELETDILGTFNTSTDRNINANQPPIEDPVAIIRQQNASWGTVSNQTTEIDVSFVVYNPKSYPVTVTELRYDIRMNDIQMGAGKTEDPYTIPPGATETVEATIRMDTQKFDEWWVSHLQNGQVTTLLIDFGATVSIGDLGSVTVPLDQLSYEKRIETNLFGGGGAGTANTTDIGDDTTPTSDDGVLAVAESDTAFITTAPLR
ncbi:MAG: LEA type 2 family protein [Halobacteriaceae archaeon]